MKRCGGSGAVHMGLSLLKEVKCSGILQVWFSSKHWKNDYLVNELDILSKEAIKFGAMKIGIFCSKQA
ncbi:unnamed protein product [Lathyrus oleraceus]